MLKIMTSATFRLIQSRLRGLEKREEDYLNFIIGLLKAENELNKKLDIPFYKETYEYTSQYYDGRERKTLITIPEIRIGLVEKIDD